MVLIRGTDAREPVRNSSPSINTGIGPVLLNHIDNYVSWMWNRHKNRGG